MKPIKLPEAELEVLASLSRTGEATARHLRELLEESRPMAHGSILTLLGRLEGKKLVAKRKAVSGKAFVYRATASGIAILTPVTRNFLNRVFGGSSVNFVASLLESKPPTADEIDELQKLLDDLRAKRKGEGTSR